MLYHKEKLPFESLLFTSYLIHDWYLTFWSVSTPVNWKISVYDSCLRHHQPYGVTISLIKFLCHTEWQSLRGRRSGYDLPGSWMNLLLFFDNTVDLWTNAARTIALLSTFTSCSSWHNIQVTNCLCSGTWVCAGPNAVSAVSETIGLR